jgi:oligogalacturonide lyase
MPYEIEGHEFFSYDGKWIWYDLQTPRSKEFWLAGVNIETGERIRYPIAREHWSVHYNISRDGKLFAGDGGGPGSVANQTPLPNPQRLSPPGNGQWIYLFTPTGEPKETVNVGGETVKVGKFAVEKLVDLSKHDYGLEPNVTITPDNKWVVFRSNIHGRTHVYAVEVAKGK